QRDRGLGEGAVVPDAPHRAPEGRCQVKRTYEVECSVCHQTKWPSLEARPRPEEGYTCALCHMVGSQDVLASQDVLGAHHVAEGAGVPLFRPRTRFQARPLRLVAYRAFDLVRALHLAPAFRRSMWRVRYHCAFSKSSISL